MASLEDFKPFAKEAEGYYFGFVSRPHLIARSSISSQPWTPWDGDPESMSKRLKCISPLLTDPILPKFSLFKYQIRDLVQSLSGWVAIDVVKIGYMSIGEPETMHGVVVLITVAVGSTTFEDAWTVVENIKKVLDKNGLSHVHVEIKEEPSTKTPVWYRSTLPVDPLTIPTCGTSIRIQGTDEIGTLGGYISIEGPTMTGRFGLTKGNWLPVKNGVPETLGVDSLLRIEAPAKLDYEIARIATENRLRRVQNQILELEGEQKRKTIKDDPDPTEQLNEELDGIKEKLSIFKGFNRNFGKIIMKSEDHLATSQWALNWALIEVDEERYRIGPDASILKNELCAYRSYPTSLTTAVPLSRSAKIRLFPETQPKSDLKIKLGRETGHRPGYINQLVSFCRRADGTATETLLFTALPVVNPAGAKADEGALVFDYDKGVVGMMIGGVYASDQLGLTDFVYVTPMDVLLEDIKKRTGATNVSLCPL